MDDWRSNHLAGNAPGSRYNLFMADQLSSYPQSGRAFADDVPLLLPIKRAASCNDTNFQIPASVHRPSYPENSRTGDFHLQNCRTSLMVYCDD
jgi:hypothetical protein